MLPERWSTSESGGRRRCLSKFVPEAAPSCVKGFVAEAAGVMLILARLASGAAEAAPEGVFGFGDEVDEASPPSGLGWTGFEAPSFAMRRWRIYVTHSQLQLISGRAARARHAREIAWDWVVCVRTCSIFSLSGASGMLGGCSFGSIVLHSGCPVVKKSVVVWTEVDDGLNAKVDGLRYDFGAPGEVPQA